MRRLFLLILLVTAFGATQGTEISPSGEPSGARKKMEDVVIPEFTVKEQGVWDAIGALRRAMKKADTDPGARQPDFLLKSTDEETPQKISLHLPNSKASEILDAIARQADCVWFCTNQSVVVVPAGKIIADYAPKDSAQLQKSACTISLEKKEVTAGSVTFHWVLTVSGVSKELFMPNLSFRLIPRNSEGAVITEKPQLKTEPLERAAGFGNYHYTMTLSGIGPDAAALDVKVLYSGSEIFREDIALKEGVVIAPTSARQAVSSVTAVKKKERDAEASPITSPSPPPVKNPLPQPKAIEPATEPSQQEKAEEKHPSMEGMNL